MRHRRAHLDASSHVGAPLQKGQHHVADSAMGCHRQPGGGHRSRARGGRRREGGQRPPGHGDEPRSRRLPAVPEGHAPRPGATTTGSAATGSSSRPATRSLTQYVQLYLGGYGLELDDLKALRTWGSKTPGHPEYGHTDGVEITTGPLGQGLASAVGFAYAAALRARPVRPGCRRRARARSTTSSTSSPATATCRRASRSEASSLAGHQQLGNLIVIYDCEPDLDRGRHQHRLHRGRRASATRRTAGTCRRSTGRRPASTSRTSPSCTPRSRRRRARPTSRRSSS